MMRSPGKESYNNLIFTYLKGRERASVVGMPKYGFPDITRITRTGRFIIKKIMLNKLTAIRS